MACSISDDDERAWTIIKDVGDDSRTEFSDIDHQYDEDEEEEEDQLLASGR